MGDFNDFDWSFYTFEETHYNNSYNSTDELAGNFTEDLLYD